MISDVSEENWKNWGRESSMITETSGPAAIVDYVEA